MGTRGAFGLRFQNTDKVLYNQFDSYPEGLGSVFLSSIEPYDIEQLAGVATRLIQVSDDAPPTPEQIKRYAPWTDLSVSNQSTSDWYCVLRGCQGNLDPLLDGSVDHFYGEPEFLINSLFCEYAYIANCDSGMVEFYVGFNKNPDAPGRYAHASSGDVYNGVVLFDEVPIVDVRGNVETIVKRWCDLVEAHHAEGGE